MTTTNQQFRTRAEAEQAAKDMDARAEASDRHALRARERNLGALMASHTTNAVTYRAEAARIRAVLHTLPDGPHTMDECQSGGCVVCDANPYDRSP